MPIPPVSLPISFCARALPSAIAFWTPLRMRSSSISTSSGSTTSFAILIESTSPAPFATTVTLPPPAVAVTFLSASSACGWSICSCIFLACCIILFMFIEVWLSGLDFRAEDLQRTADERIVLEFRHRIGRRFFLVNDGRFFGHAILHDRLESDRFARHRGEDFLEQIAV